MIEIEHDFQKLADSKHVHIKTTAGNQGKAAQADPVDYAQVMNSPKSSVQIHLHLSTGRANPSPLYTTRQATLPCWLSGLNPV